MCFLLVDRYFGDVSLAIFVHSWGLTGGLALLNFSQPLLHLPHALPMLVP